MSKTKTEPIRGVNELHYDPNYRYMMETLIFQKEKTKTCIINLDNIAKNIKVPNAGVIVSFFKARLSIAIAIKKGRVIISNDTDIEKIRQALYEFIEYYVLCPKCKLPEVIYEFNKKGDLFTNCNSCGNIHGVEQNRYTEKVNKNIIIAINK